MPDSFVIPVWLKGEPGQWLLSIHAQPGARTGEVVGAHGESLKIRIAAPPVDGKANLALMRWLAQRLDVPQRELELISGDSARSKRLRLRSTMPAKQLVERLLSDPHQGRLP